MVFPIAHANEMGRIVKESKKTDFAKLDKQTQAFFRSNGFDRKNDHYQSTIIENN